MSTLTLVILAAGRGSRFGGDKALAEVGPGGQSLFEYSIYDAYRAGFKHVVFVVNDQRDTSDYSSRLAFYGDSLKIDFVVQDLVTGVSNDKINLEEVPRTKPWGTGHAVLVCHAMINNPFVVINADDYYGRQNFKIIGSYLQENKHNPQVCALPGYKLKNTLSRSGGVNRGICSVDPDGYLVSIHEVKNITLDKIMVPRDDQAENISNESIVSMTFWGFHPSLFKLLDNAFQLFLVGSTDLVNDEFYIPEAVDLAINSDVIKVKVFHTSEIWKGVTYAADVADVSDYLSALHDAGFYKQI